MKGRRRTKTKKQSSYKDKLVNQSIFCLIMIIAVLCINSVNKTGGNVFIKNVRTSLYTSLDYKKTADSIKDIFSHLVNEGVKNNDKTTDTKAD